MSNSVNFYEFIGFVTFNIAVHELGLIIVYRFLLDRILVSMVPRATVHTLNLNNLKPLKNLTKPKRPTNIFSFFRFLPALDYDKKSENVRPFVRASVPLGRS